MAKAKIRCAIYTRKSTDQGLDQAFNSLDAQYEACKAYIASQTHEGWRLHKTHYEDAALSGGTLNRDGLQRLLADIEAGRIDMIVVYKIDRLTRSLSDFSKIMERLEAAQASFTSVTQSFNTASSMGRLTLNMLLSFAQFEREVTAERIRDKIAASKAKGIWMGGTVPMGYDRKGEQNTRRLGVNPAEAQQIRRLFTLYDQRGTVKEVHKICLQEGICSKHRPHYAPTRQGNKPLTRGQIHNILTNPLYIGKIKHKNHLYAGQHEGIIDLSLWQRVQNTLQAKSSRQRGQGKDATQPIAPLRGKMFDETGDRLTPSHTKRRGKILRYYISNRLIKGKDPNAWRLPATGIEGVITDCILSHIKQTAFLTGLADLSLAQMEQIQNICSELCPNQVQARLSILIQRIDLAPDHVCIRLDPASLASLLGLEQALICEAQTQIDQPLQMRKRGVERKIIIGQMTPAPDARLQDMLIRARGWADQLREGIALKQIAEQEKCYVSFIRKRIPLAFLSPKIQRMILEGQHPAEWSIRSMMAQELPMDWAMQERMLGIG